MVTGYSGKHGDVHCSPRNAIRGHEQVSGASAACAVLVSLTRRS